MALIRAAMESARKLEANYMSVRFITSLSKHAFPSGDELSDLNNTRLTSLVLRYKMKYPLYVSDLTDLEWCEKRAQFILADRIPEVMQRVKKATIRAWSAEDRWAEKLLDFVIGSNQLLSKGVTHELPVIGVVEGEWVSGKIDEIQMLGKGIERKPVLVGIKTRSSPTCPSKSQQRNRRLQLMLYKHMWDTLVSSNFPTKHFFERFSLNPHTALSEFILNKSRNLGIPAKTLEEMMRYFTNTCSMLPISQDEMIVRYKLQKDKSLLRKFRFEIDPDWFMKQVRGNLEFWRGEREANFVPEEERWKCKLCAYASKCPVSNANLENGTTSSTTNYPDGESSNA